MEPLPLIPTPMQQRWREFRIQVLPVIFFIAVIAALVFTWKNYVQPVGIVGEVESIKANATSLSDGTLVSLSVSRFDRVTQGQVIGEIQTFNPEFQAATLGAMAVDLKLLQAEMNIDRTRGIDSYSRMRLDLLSERVTLNLAKIHLVQVEKEFQRIEKLFNEGVISAGQGYDVAKRDRDILRAEVEDRGSLVAAWEQEVVRIESTGVGEVSEHEALIQEAITAKEMELQQTLAPVQLIAPIDGIVSMVYRQEGERIVRGEPLVTVGATTGDRIIGYLRQPIHRRPQPQDVVTIRKRGLPPMMAEGTVLEVGAQLEPINPVLLSADANVIEMGLPVLISMPPTLRDSLIPGQAVDLVIEYANHGNP